MRNLILVTFILAFFTACNDNYLSKKRDGLKPYPEHERQAEEAPENEHE